VSAYFAALSVRTAAAEVTSSLEVTDALRDQRGALRIGAVTYAVDIATGLASGLAVIDRDLWVVTTDLDVHMTEPVVDGPVRIDASAVRAGATTVVAAFSVHDDGTGRQVGGGTATFRPFAFEFDRAMLDTPIGVERRHDIGVEVDRTRLVDDLGFEVGEDGSATVAVDGWLRNPWGMLHGGVTACLIDVAAELAGSAALGRPARATGEMVRFVAPSRVGPVRAVPTVLSLGDDGRVLVEVRVIDTGADDRLTAIGTVTLA
jgi:uncharacterized protein (TIGR00369 family)